MNVYLIIRYDGTDFVGWQVQPSGRSVQGEIEQAIKRVTGSETRVTASGRTDSGVHAAGQVANFITEAEIPPEKFAAALNAVLPKDVKIVKSGRAKDDFNARFSAKKKTYIYNIYRSDIEDPLKERYAVRVYENLDLQKMRAAAEILEGTHDFKCFLSSGSSVKGTVRTVYSIKIVKRGADYKFSVTGNGFLYNMVRIMVGTLIAAGAGKLALDDIRDGLNGGARDKMGKTMPAKGLTLLKVDYFN